MRDLTYEIQSRWFAPALIKDLIKSQSLPHISSGTLRLGISPYHSLISMAEVNSAASEATDSHLRSTVKLFYPMK